MKQMERVWGLYSGMCLFAVLVVGCCSKYALPRADLVPDRETAIAMASILIKAQYGERILQLNLPLTAQLSNGVWLIEGTLPQGWVGGVATVRISMKDARILEFYHTK